MQAHKETIERSRRRQEPQVIFPPLIYFLSRHPFSYRFFCPATRSLLLLPSNSNIGTQKRLAKNTDMEYGPDAIYVKQDYRIFHSCVKKGENLMVTGHSNSGMVF